MLVEFLAGLVILLIGFVCGLVVGVVFATETED